MAKKLTKSEIKTLIDGIKTISAYYYALIEEIEEKERKEENLKTIFRIFETKIKPFINSNRAFMVISILNDPEYDYQKMQTIYHHIIWDLNI